MVISQKKIQPFSIIHKQAHKLSKSSEKWKRRRKYKVWFKIYFDLSLLISPKQQYFIATTLAPKVVNWPPKLIGIIFYFFLWALGPSQGPKVVD
jgi:hypothetical protein